MKVEVIEPHGLCAGVNAAIAKALTLRGVYCLHELVHNEIVVDELKGLGYSFVDRIEDVPDGETVVFSAHGVAPQVRAYAEKHGMKVVDTTCPFVAKVHRAARDFVKKGLPVAVIGDRDHAEVKGILGEIPKDMVLEDCAGRPKIGAGRPCIGVVSQTTMNADDVARQVDALRRRYDVRTMAEVCRATKERQDAVRAFCARAAAGSGTFGVLVLGSRMSSNSRRLAEVAGECGARTFKAGTMDELRAIDFSRVMLLGVTSGASTPERFFADAVRYLRSAPQHVAMVVGSNGRRAMQRGNLRAKGYLVVAMFGDMLKWCADRGIQYLTVYAFSTESWNRAKEEVDGLMELFTQMLRSVEGDFFSNKVRFRMIGRRGDLSAELRGVIETLEAKTAHFDRQFIAAISYGGRAEIIDAVNAAMEKGEKLTEETFRSYLYAPDVPDPDLVIHIGGVLRTSVFPIWESAYSECYFTETPWSDFKESEFNAALEAYSRRHCHRACGDEDSDDARYSRIVALNRARKTFRSVPGEP